jgi:hypothetical protein
MARPSESAKVDEETRLCESNSCSNGSFMYDVSMYVIYPALAQIGRFLKSSNGRCRSVHVKNVSSSSEKCILQYDTVILLIL